MTTIRAYPGITAAILVAIVAVIVAPEVFPGIGSGTRAAFADPPAKPAADKKADKPAAPAPDKSEKKEMVSDADAKKYADFFEKLIAIVVATQDDCVKMATGINGHIDANQALIKEMNGPKNNNKELPPAVKERIQKKVRDELTPAITKKCSTDKGVEAAFNRMGAGRAK